MTHSIAGNTDLARDRRLAISHQCGLAMGALLQRR